MKRLGFFLLLFVSSSSLSVQAASTVTTRLEFLGIYDQTSFMTYSGSSRSAFKGIGYGGAYEIQVNKGKVGFGLRIPVEYRSLSNQANIAGAASQNETLKGWFFGLQPGLNIENFFVGIGIRLGKAQNIFIQSGSTTTRIEYVFYGVGMRAGYDLYLGKTFYLSPSAYYDVLNAAGIDAVSTRKANSYGISIGLGFNL